MTATPTSTMFSMTWKRRNWATTFSSQSLAIIHKNPLDEVAFREPEPAPTVTPSRLGQGHQPATGGRYPQG